VYTVNNTHVKQFTEKKTQRFICIQMNLCVVDQGVGVSVFVIYPESGSGYFCHQRLNFKKLLSDSDSGSAVHALKCKTHYAATFSYVVTMQM